MKLLKGQKLIDDVLNSRREASVCGSSVGSMHWKNTETGTETGTEVGKGNETELRSRHWYELSWNESMSNVSLAL